MAKPELKRTDDVSGVCPTDDYAPRKYSAREHAAMGLKIFLVAGLLFGLLWLVEALKGQ